MQLLDYSQYSSFQFCPWRWYEHYVRGMSRRWDGQKNDALTLGTLVHNAMDNFAKYGRPEIDAECVSEANPTPECYDLAVRLVHGYIRTYPSEQWAVERAEQPLRFPIHRSIQSNYPGPDMDGLAKLDGYFYVPEDTTLESGLPGYTLTLQRGWWAKEYKTKSPSVDRNKWVREWQSKRQADFQILALQEMLRSAGVADIGEEGKWHDVVQGVLVCVMEKPREHTPKRKCQGCKETWEFSIYIPSAAGHVCPVCNHTNVFREQKPLAKREPEYFRITVARTPEQLEAARQEIAQVALEMDAMRQHGMLSRAPDRDSCVSNRYHSECEFFNPHTYGGVVEEGQQYVKVDPLKYIGLPKEDAA